MPFGASLLLFPHCKPCWVLLSLVSVSPLSSYLASSRAPAIRWYPHTLPTHVMSLVWPLPYAIRGYRNHMLLAGRCSVKGAYRKAVRWGLIQRNYCSPCNRRGALEYFLRSSTPQSQLPWWLSKVFQCPRKHIWAARTPSKTSWVRGYV